MTEGAGTWTTVEVAGHQCEWYEPTRLNPHGHTVIYLHGVHQNRLHDKSRANKAGIKVYIVEHDHPAAAFDSIKTSYGYLSKLSW